MSRYCSYLLPGQDGGTSQILVNGRLLPTRWDTLYFSETEYDEIIGGAEWPSGPYLESAFRSFMNTSGAPDDLTEEFMEHQVGKNLARVDVFYDSLNVESIIESRKYTVRSRIYRARLKGVPQVA